jgi:UDP-N-acetyl-D-mannosaminuronic acid dehydrogenase
MLETDGQSWHIAYCPERIAQGYAIRELATLPQLVAGLTEKAIDDACALFSTIAPKLIRVTMEEAELAKLFSNAWRYIQFAVANQFYMMSTEIGVDYDSVRKAMIDGYGRAATLPGAGFAAGPCLLKDTMQLAAFQRNHFLLGHAAMMINEGLPDFLVHTLSQTRDLATSKVGILGMAFKGDIDDTRASLSYKLGKRLRFHGATVFYSDEFARDPTFVSKEELVAKSDVVIVGAPHTAYRELEIPPGVELVDLWGILRAGSVLALPRSTARGG